MDADAINEDVVMRHVLEAGRAKVKRLELRLRKARAWLLIQRLNDYLFQWRASMGRSSGERLERCQMMRDRFAARLDRVVRILHQTERELANVDR